ncbi:hypothetical protein GCM10018780_39800 [Streptomyces lanatus]|nr:hypothetical protein GCM10018780_39800 [Streptomyces lanatus]
MVWAMPERSAAVRGPSVRSPRRVMANGKALPVAAPSRHTHTQPSSGASSSPARESDFAAITASTRSRWPRIRAAAKGTRKAGGMPMVSITDIIRPAWPGVRPCARMISGSHATST